MPEKCYLQGRTKIGLELRLHLMMEVMQCSRKIGVKLKIDISNLLSGWTVTLESLRVNLSIAVLRLR